MIVFMRVLLHTYMYAAKAADPAQALADIYAGVVGVCLEFPKTCKCVSTWGFSDAYNHWATAAKKPLPAPGAFYYDERYRPKRAREAVAAVLVKAATVAHG
jgi:GH35 family endo-1,4-beta-xylanase